MQKEGVIRCAHPDKSGRTRFAHRPGSIAAGRTLLSDSHHSQCKKQYPGIFRGIVFYAEREGFEPSIALVRTMTV